MNNNDILVFDFETGDANPHTCVPLSLAAKLYGARSLQPIPGAEFLTYMRPKDDEWDKIKSEALAVNGITLDQLKQAPEREAAWKAFVTFVNRFNKKPGCIFTAPVAAGHNIFEFDLIIIDRLAKEYGPVDKTGRTALFSAWGKLDLRQILFLVYENYPKLKSCSMDAMREHFGLETKGAHGANMVDVRQTGELLMKFIKKERSLFDRVPGLKGIHQEKAA